MKKMEYIIGWIIVFILGFVFSKFVTPHDSSPSADQMLIENGINPERLRQLRNGEIDYWEYADTPFNNMMQEQFDQEYLRYYIDHREDSWFATKTYVLYSKKAARYASDDYCEKLENDYLEFCKNAGIKPTKTYRQKQNDKLIKWTKSN